MRSLGSRLSLIASMVPETGSVCDVGTDHGYLPAYLFLNGKHTAVTASDINKAPLENARKNLEKLGAKGVKLVLCDGLSGIERSDADTVIISGMGGDVISGILSKCSFIKDEKITLILQPMTAADILRTYLSENGFKTLKEEAVEENGKIYSVMLCRHCEKPFKIDEVGKRIGILKADSDANRQYIKKQLDICIDCKNALEACDSVRAAFYADIAGKLQELLLFGGK